MAYNFPDTPANGDIIQTAGRRFAWDGTQTRWEYRGLAQLNGTAGSITVPGTNTWTDATSSPTTITSTGCVEVSLDNVNFSVGTISVSSGTTFYTRWNTGATCDDPVNNLGAAITGTITDDTTGATETYTKTVAAVAWTTSPTAPTEADGVTTSTFTYGEGAGNATSTGCIEFEVNGSGTFAQGPTAVTTGDTIKTRWIYTAGSGTCADSAHNTTVTGTFQNDGGQVENFSLTIDKVADAFTFSPATSTNAPSLVTSTTPSFTLAGVNAPTSIWAALTTTSGGTAPTTAEFSVDGGTTYTALAAAPGTDYVNPGATIQVRFVTGDTVSTTDTLTVSVGPDVANKQDGTYTVTVSKPAFANVTNYPTVADGTTTASTTWANGSTTINGTGCIEFSVDGGTTFTQAATAITNGTNLLTRWIASAACADAPHNTTITGNIENATNADNASLLIDRVPAAFTVTDQTGIALNTATNSASFTISGTNATTYLQFTGDATNPLTTPQASINAGAFAAIPAAGTYTLAVPPGAAIIVQGTTGAAITTAYLGDVIMGDAVANASDNWSVTTAAAVPTISQPSITAPSDDATGITTSPNETSSAYTGVNSPGPHTCSDWELYRDTPPITSTNTITNVTNNAGSPLTEVTSAATLNIKDIRYNGSLYVTVGKTGEITTSTDGINWTAQTSGTTDTFESVTYGNGLWVAATPDNPDVYTSPDGITWTQRPGALTDGGREVRYLGGLFVLGTKNGDIYTSTDGISWTQRLNTGSGKPFKSIAYNGSRWVTVGAARADNTDNIFYSDDAITWTRAASTTAFSTDLGQTKCDMPAVLWDGSVFRASGGNGGTIGTSTDGSTWTASQPAVFTTGGEGLSFSGSTYLFSGNGRTYESTDFVNWTELTNTLSGSIPSNIWDGSRFIVGTGNAQIATYVPASTTLTIAGAQTDGFETGWQIDDCGGGAGPGTIQSLDDTQVTLAGSPTGFAIGENICTVGSATPCTSSNTATNVTTDATFGGTWAVSGGADVGNADDTAFDGVTTAYTETDNLYYTTDGGLTFTQSATFNAITPPNNTLYVSATANSWVITDQDGNTWYSTAADGAPWTFVDNTAQFTTTIQDAFYANGLHFILGSNGEILTSSNGGATWTAQNSGFTVPLKGGTYANGLYVVVGDTGFILTSPDAVTWTRQTTGVGTSTDFESIAYGNGIFMAVGDSGLIRTSPDGINWSTIGTPNATTSGLRVAYSGGVFAVSYQANAAYSTDNGATWTARTDLTTGGATRLVFFAGGNLLASKASATEYISAPSTTITISGAQSDGCFAVGDQVTDCQGGAAQTIKSIDNTQIVLIGSTTDFAIGESVCKVGTDVQTVTCSTTDLTSWTPVGPLDSGSNYYTRVRYKDDSSTGSLITSPWSAWSKYTTS